MPTTRVLQSNDFSPRVGHGAPWCFCTGTRRRVPVATRPAASVPGRRLAPDLIGMGDSGSPTRVHLRRSRDLPRCVFDRSGLDRVVLVATTGADACLRLGRAASRSGSRHRLHRDHREADVLEDFPASARPLFESIRRPAWARRWSWSRQLHRAGTPRTVAAG